MYVLHDPKWSLLSLFHTVRRFVSMWSFIHIWREWGRGPRGHCDFTEHHLFCHFIRCWEIRVAARNHRTSHMALLAVSALGCCTGPVLCTVPATNSLFSCPSLTHPTPTPLLFLCKKLWKGGIVQCACVFRCWATAASYIVHKAKISHNMSSSNQASESQSAVLHLYSCMYIYIQLDLIFFHVCNIDSHIEGAKTK